VRIVIYESNLRIWSSSADGRDNCSCAATFGGESSWLAWRADTYRIVTERCNLYNSAGCTINAPTRRGESSTKLQLVPQDRRPLQRHSVFRSRVFNTLRDTLRHYRLLKHFRNSKTCSETSNRKCSKYFVDILSQLEKILSRYSTSSPGRGNCDLDLISICQSCNQYKIISDLDVS